MPKGSFNPEMAKQGGGGVEKGKFLVKSASTQNLKTDYRANQLYLVLDCALLDDNWQPVREAEDVELKFSFGKESLAHFRPAVGKDANDNDPVDQGDAPDAKGNTFIAVDTEPVNRSTSVMVLFDSLVKQGFPKQVLDQAWAPAFVGMQFELATYTSKECNDKFSTRLNTKPIKDATTGEEKPVTYKVVVKWQNPNYLTGGAQTAVSLVSTSAAIAAPAVTVSTSAVIAAPAVTSETIEETFTKVIKLVVDRKKGSEIKSEQAMTGFATNAHVQGKLPGKPTDIHPLVRDAKKLAAALMVAGVPVSIDDDTGEPKPVTYPIQIPA